MWKHQNKNKNKHTHTHVCFDTSLNNTHVSFDTSLNNTKIFTNLSIFGCSLTFMIIYFIKYIYSYDIHFSNRLQIWVSITNTNFWKNSLFPKLLLGTQSCTIIDVIYLCTHFRIFWPIIMLFIFTFSFNLSIFSGHCMF